MTRAAALSIEPARHETVIVQGFEGEEIELGIEQLEPRNMPESTAGFLE